MMGIARESEKFRLLLNYREEKESLKLFLNNSIALNKLEHFMKEYPKLGKRLLKIDLKQLETA
jgi:hypothetical protein